LELQKQRTFQFQRVPKTSRLEAIEFDLTGYPCVDLEIGCGVGWHPIAYARQNPQRLLLALEHGRSRFEKFERRLQHQASLPNLRALHADVIPLATHRLPTQSLDRIMMLYPNPYPKASQANKRFHNMPFFEVLKDRLKVGGILEIRSNVLAYTEEARHQICGRWGLRLANCERISRLSHPEYRCQTHFELKYFQRAETLEFLTFEKKPA